MKSKSLLIVFLALILVFAGGYYYQSRSKKNESLKTNIKEVQLKEFTIAVPYIKARQLPLIIAEREGFLKENGLKPKIIKVEKDLGAVLASGKIPTSLASAVSALPPAISGADLVWVAQLANDNPSGLISFKEPEDIKSVGVQSGVSRTLSLAVIRKMGLNPANMTFENMPSNPAKFAALKTKKIDAIFVALMDWEMFKAKTGLGVEYKIVGQTDQGDNLLPTWFVAKKSYIESDGETVEKVLSALLKADDFIKKNPNKAMADLRLDSKELTADDARIIVNGYVDSMKNLDIVPNIETVKKLLPILAKDNPKANDFDPALFVYPDIAKKLQVSAK